MTRATQGQVEDNRNWRIFYPYRFWGMKQRIYEAWLILSGSHSLHRAWQLGLQFGSSMEYRRLITNRAYLAEIAASTKP